MAMPASVSERETCGWCGVEEGRSLEVGVEKQREEKNRKAFVNRLLSSILVSESRLVRRLPAPLWLRPNLGREVRTLLRSMETSDAQERAGRARERAEKSSPSFVVVFFSWIVRGEDASLSRLFPSSKAPRLNPLFLPCG